MSMENVKCADCGYSYPETEKVCPQCNSRRKIVYISCKPATIKFAGEITGMRGKKPHLTGKKKHTWEWKNVRTVRRDNGKQVRRFMLVDREKNWYEEVVTDLETGEIIHECKEPLTDHMGHGSAKKK